MQEATSELLGEWEVQMQEARSECSEARSEMLGEGTSRE
jgi:hypothetical protein